MSSVSPQIDIATLLTTALQPVRDDLAAVKQGQDDIRAELRDLRTDHVDCERRCEGKRSAIYDDISTLRERQTLSNGIAKGEHKAEEKQERKEKARGEIDYVFWAKITALVAGASLAPRLIDVLIAVVRHAP